MTPEERRVLYPLARNLRLEHEGTWSDLKYETQHGPQFVEFPYYPAALEFQRDAQGAIDRLGNDDKTVLLTQWRSKPRHPYDFNNDRRILQQYAIILVDLMVTRARRAGAR